MDESKLDASRIEVLKKIKQYETEGGESFFKDVENDPPAKELKPEDVDYLNKKFMNRFRRMIACKMGKKMRKDHNKLNQIEVIGIEKLQGIKYGIITSNHFGFFESACASKVIAELNKRNKLYIVIREGNYSMPGPYGFLFRHCDTLPLSSNKDTMKNFTKALKEVLHKRKQFVLVYPEQSMWWNYRKPRPQRPGAAHFAVTNKVPLIPLFVTMSDLDELDEFGAPIQKYTVHVGDVMYADPNKTNKENIQEMTEKNYNFCVETYERVYQKKLVYGE